MKFALAHHWLTSYRGGERVLEHMAPFAPGADIYTLVHNKRVLVPCISDRDVITSGLNRIPKIEKAYRHLLPLHPWAISRMRVPDDVNLLLSSDAALIKGVTTGPDTTHVCYCHSPPRYLWEMGDEYKRASRTTRLALDRFAPALRRFDYAAAQRVTHFIANSNFVANRIAKYYGRDAEVIYPPVAVEEFSCTEKRQPYFVVVSELVPYKRVDLAVQAFNKLGERLIVIGEGPERKKLEEIAESNISFLGRQPFGRLKVHLESARGFIFPGVEDFGITPVEAQAAGCPVIAFRAGGALETVVDGQTGTFFDEQSPECLAECVRQFDASDFDPLVCNDHAAEFTSERFRSRYAKFLSRVTRRTVVPRPRQEQDSDRKAVTAG